MSHHDQAPPQEPDDAVDAALRHLLSGPSPANTVHDAIELERASTALRPSDVCIERARYDILAALWGPSW